MNTTDLPPRTKQLSLRNFVGVVVLANILLGGAVNFPPPGVRWSEIGVVTFSPNGSKIAAVIDSGRRVQRAMRHAHRDARRQVVLLDIADGSRRTIVESEPVHSDVPCSPLIFWEWNVDFNSDGTELWIAR